MVISLSEKETDEEDENYLTPTIVASSAGFGKKWHVVSQTRCPMHLFQKRFKFPPSFQTGFVLDGEMARLLFLIKNRDDIFDET